jgi:hypothetical protein
MASRPIKPKKKAPNSTGLNRQVPPIRVSSVASYLDELTKLDFARKKLWFRGVGNSGYSLSPSLFRHSAHTTKAALAKLEGDLNETFRMRSFPYTDASRWQDDVWDQLFLCSITVSRLGCSTGRRVRLSRCILQSPRLILVRAERPKLTLLCGF